MVVSTNELPMNARYWLNLGKETYEMMTGIPDTPGIRCRVCGMVSCNPNDIENRYCGNCHAFHDQWKQMWKSEIVAQEDG